MKKGALFRVPFFLLHKSACFLHVARFSKRKIESEGEFLEQGI